MLISLKYRFLFIHIAKTGGTSVRSALQRYRWRDPWCWLGAVCNRISDASGHRLGVKIPRHAKAVAALELLPRETFDSLFKFAFVRNPWDLQVSSWHHIRRERPHIIPDSVKEFPDFVRWKLDPERPYHYIVDTSIALQSDYLIDLHRRIIVDFIGRYENLLDHFRQACQEIGIAPPSLPHRRKATGRRDYRHYYDDRTAELVAQHFRRDIEMLKYSFDGPQPQEPITPAEADTGGRPPSGTGV